MLRTFQLDEKGQERLVAILSIAAVQVKNPPAALPGGTGSLMIYNRTETEIIAASMAIIMGARQIGDIDTIPHAEQSSNLKETHLFLQKLIIDLSEGILGEYVKDASI